MFIKDYTKPNDYMIQYKRPISKLITRKWKHGTRRDVHNLLVKFEWEHYAFRRGIIPAVDDSFWIESEETFPQSGCTIRGSSIVFPRDTHCVMETFVTLGQAIATKVDYKTASVQRIGKQSSAAKFSISDRLVLCKRILLQKQNVVEGKRQKLLETSSTKSYCI